MELLTEFLYTGCQETFQLNMSNLTWSTLTSVKDRHPLTSEGLSVCSTFIDGEQHLVAFGGYNGRYNNEIFVLRLKPRDLSLTKILRSRALAAVAACVTDAFAESEMLDSMETEDTKNFKVVEDNYSEEDITDNILPLKKRNTALKNSLTEIRAKNFVMRKNIYQLDINHYLMSKQHQTLRSRCSNFEAQIAEMEKMSEHMKEELERELTASEQDAELSPSAEAKFQQ